MGIICPPSYHGWDRVNWSAKIWGSNAPPPHLPQLLQHCCASIARAHGFGLKKGCCDVIVQLPAWPRTSKLHSSLLCHYGKIGYLHYQKFHPLQKRIFRPLCIAQQTIVVLHRLGHGLRTPNEAFFQWYPKLLGLGRQIGPINFVAFEVFSAELSAPILAWWVPCPCFPIINQKTKLLYSYPK